MDFEISIILSIYQFAQKSGILDYIKKLPEKSVDAVYQKLLQEKLDIENIFEPKIEKIFNDVLSSIAPKNKSLKRKFISAVLTCPSLLTIIEDVKLGKLPNEQIFIPIFSKITPKSSPDVLAKQFTIRLKDKLSHDQNYFHKTQFEIQVILREIRDILKQLKFPANLTYNKDEKISSGIAHNSVTDILVREAKRIIETFEKRKIYNEFISPQIQGKETNGVLENYSLDMLISQFQSKESPSVSYILGEFGTGKTWLMRKCEYELAKLFLTNPEKMFFPVFFNLRDINDISIGLETIFFTAYRNLIKKDCPLNDKLIFLLDSLDEASRQNSFSKFRYFIHSLNNYSISKQGPKIVIASRRSFFKEIKSASDIFEVDPLIRLLEINLKLWESHQILAYINKHDDIPPDARTNLHRFVDKHTEIAGRALIIGFLVEKWDKFENIVNTTDFDEFTLFDKMIYSTIKEWAERSPVLDNKQILQKLHFFIKQLALSFLDSESNQRIEVLELEKRIYQKFKKFNLNQLLDNLQLSDLASKQVKTRSILEMTEDRKYYQFCHIAIWEYIVADMIIDAIINLNQDKTQNKKFYKTVVKQARHAPLLYMSIANQFILPIMKKKNQLHLLEKYIPNL